MKKLMVMLIILLVAGCSDRPVSIWTMTSQRTDLKVLAGSNIDGIEAGVVATWTPVDDVKWGPEPSGVGFYFGADTTWLVTADDTPEPAPFPIALFDDLTAVPFGRVEFLDVVENDNFGNVQPQWVGGMRFLLDEQGTMAIVYEYSDGDQARGDHGVGLNWRF